MKLLLSLPKGVNESDVIFSLPYNLNRKAKKTEGHFILSKDKIYVYLGDEIKEEYPLDHFDELVCEQLIGCSMLVGKKDEESHFLCAFSQKFFIRYAEITKIFEYYKKTGRLITQTEDDEVVCEKCGLPLEGAPTCPECTKKSQVLIKLIKRTIPYKWNFILAVICTVIIQLTWTIVPYIEGSIMIDKFIVPRRIDTSFYITCGIYIGIFIFLWLFEHINMKMSFKVALNVGRDLRQELFDKTQKLSMTSISKRTAGELISRVSSDASKLQDFVTANGKDAIVKLFQLVVIMVILLALNWKLAILVLVPVPIVMFAVVKLFNIMSIRYGKVWRLMTRSSSLLHDILNGIRVVKSYGNEKREIDKYTKASKEWADSCYRAEAIWYLTMPVADFFMTIGNFFVIYFGSKMVLGDTLSIGMLVQYTVYVSMLYEPLRWVIQIPRLLADTSVSASRVFEIIDEAGDNDESDNAVELDIKGDIEFQNVYFGYKTYNPVLKDISCRINKGEMIGIVGHSGVGKSTMINLILRLYDTTDGSIKIDGVDIKSLSQNSLRRQIGVVLQETFLFDGNVLDNISYAKPDAAFEEIVNAAKIANAHDFIVRLPDGYNTRVGDKGHSLSGGERQRIAIARAILHNPKILILDEATASLDTQTEKQIQEALDRLIKGRTTIAIAHRLSTLSNADKLIVLDKGKLAEFGSHEELMAKYGVYYNLVMAQRQTTKMKKAE